MRQLLSTLLEDDCDTKHGGVSFSGQTLKDFLEEVELIELVENGYMKIGEINSILTDNGIKKVKELE